MRLVNTTDFPDHFLRRMVAWCCREAGLPASHLRTVRFAKWRVPRGRAWRSLRQILVRIAPDQRFPFEWQLRGRGAAVMRDAFAAAVFVTAHEVQHHVIWRNGKDRSLALARDLEPHCDRAGNRAMRAFEANRNALLAEWSESPKARAAKAVVSLQETRAAKVDADLARWQRKLKLAQTKVRKLKTRARYYERQAAAAPKGCYP